VVLYALGSEQVQGFAVTLSLGLIASLFTSVVVTRAVFDLAMARGWMARFRTFHLLPETAMDFMRVAPWCIACSGILVAGGLFHLVAIQGRDMLAVDFTGGRILQLRFAEGKPIREVRERVARVLKEGGYPEGPDAQVQSLLPAGGLDTGAPRDFQIVTRNRDMDQDRVRELARTALGAALRNAPAEMPADPSGRMSFTLDFSSPQDTARVRQALADVGLKGAEVSPLGDGASGGATQARLLVTPHRLLEDLKAAFGRELVPSAFQVAPGDIQAHTRVLCAVRDMTGVEVLARLDSPAVNLKGCRVAVEAPDERGVSALRIESPVQDVEEVKQRLLRYFGPELCLQDVPYAKVHPDGACDVEIRLDSPLSMVEIGSRQTDIRKQLGLELGSSGRVIEDADPANPGNAVKALSMNYKSGMKELMQYLHFVRANLPLVAPFREAVPVPAMARLSFSVVDAGKGLEPAQRVAQSVGGTVLDAALTPHPGGFHAAMEVPAHLTGKTQALLRKGYTEDLSDPIPRDDVVGAVVAQEAIVKAVWALAAAGAALILYIAFRFEFISGVAAVVAVMHDVLITLAVLSFTHTQIDMTLVAALLTIIGFSVNDTIVIFDRIRENLGGKWNVPAGTFGRVVNLSVNQTLSRTLLTSLTVFIAVISLFRGGEVFRGFAVAMLAGVVSGTYSTVYIAAPLAQIWRRRSAPPQAA
jgi:preprotein translocase SecF subunit